MAVLSNRHQYITLVKVKMEFGRADPIVVLELSKYSLSTRIGDVYLTWKKFYFKLNKMRPKLQLSSDVDQCPLKCLHFYSCCPCLVLGSCVSTTLSQKLQSRADSWFLNLVDRKSQHSSIFQRPAMLITSQSSWSLAWAATPTLRSTRR